MVTTSRVLKVGDAQLALVVKDMIFDAAARRWQSLNSMKVSRVLAFGVFDTRSTAVAV